MKVSILGQYTIIRLATTAGDSTTAELSFLGRTPAEMRDAAAALRKHAARDLRNAKLCEAAAAAMEGKKGDVIDPAVAVCCSKCNGTRVEEAMWVDPNTDEVGEHFGSCNAGDNTFCADCEDHTDLIDRSAP